MVKPWGNVGAMGMELCGVEGLYGMRELWVN